MDKVERNLQRIRECTREFIWIRIPKTGSTSINSLLHDDINQPHFSSQVFLDLDRQRYNELFKFTIVRNPWDRLVTCYHYYRHKKSSFEQWIKNGMKNNIADSKFYPISPIHQLGWFTDEEDNSMVDFIGKLENIDKDWKIICDILKIDEPEKIPHKNKSRPRGKHYSTYYDKELKNLVGDICSEEIKLLNYEF